MARDDVLRVAWKDPRFRALRDSARALFDQLVILGPPSSAGVLPLIPAKWASGLPDATERSVMADLAVLAASDFVAVDAMHFEVLIRNYIRDSGSWRNPNHFRGALNAAQSVDSPLLRSYLAAELHKIGGPLVDEVVEILSPETDFGLTGDASATDRPGLDDGAEEVR